MSTRSAATTLTSFVFITMFVRVHPNTLNYTHHRFLEEKGLTKETLARAILLDVASNGHQPQRGYLNGAYRCPPGMSKLAHIANITWKLLQSGAVETEDEFSESEDEMTDVTGEKWVGSRQGRCAARKVALGKMNLRTKIRTHVLWMIAQYCG